jgi:hypothetical protein
MVDRIERNARRERATEDDEPRRSAPKSRAAVKGKIRPKASGPGTIGGPASASGLAAAKAAGGFNRKSIALVYDFDGTLSPKPMQEYTVLPKLGVDPHEFWAESNRIAEREGADSLITYMHLMYKKAKAAGVRIDRSDLVALGRDVELFDGVESWFDDIEDYVRIRSESAGIEVRHYLISSGLVEIIEGTRIFPRFKNVFASEYWFEAYDLPYPKRVITDTGKTQYLFRINKGVEDLGQSINQHMPEGERPIPFSQMIYFGDGDTDVPSMTVMRKNGGYAIAVHPPRKNKQKCVDLLQAGRIDFFAVADYKRGSELFRRTTRLLDRIIADIQLQEEMWHFRRGVEKGRER